MQQKISLFGRTKKIIPFVCLVSSDQAKVDESHFVYNEG